MRVAHVIVDIPTKALDKAFDYEVGDDCCDVRIGHAVLVDFANRPAVGYVVGFSASTEATRLKRLGAVLDGPFFGEDALATAEWVASEYMAPLSEALRLFLPPGGTPRAVRHECDGGYSWALKRPDVGRVDDRWAILAPGSDYLPKQNANTQRAILDALAAGPVRVAELSADLGSIGGALKALEKAGAVRIELRRRLRDGRAAERPAVRPVALSAGQADALGVIRRCLDQHSGVVALDGVTGSGKTEVYLQAIEDVLASGGSACVLVPEISLTPQTVGRFRSRFGEGVAVLHSRLSAGERFDQWDRVRNGEASIVVGARSALFAPMRDLRLIVIDEEHESSYKQGSSPRYHARDVARRMSQERGAVLVLGSASLSMETRESADRGECALVPMPERVTGHPLPDVFVVDMAAEFADGHRSMFSRQLTAALQEAREKGEKAVIFLNRRGFASFLLCRDCGHVPRCESCATSMTFHQVGNRLMCHHCGATRQVPPRCPSCESPYLRQFGAGTQRIESELESILPGWPVVRMDADTTKGKGAHERLLASFEALDSGVLLGTQMIAKGLDFPEVTVVGVAAADITLNIPDFRSGERTYQLLEQVAGRAGRGTRPGKVYVQTYWPDHPAILAAARHDAAAFYAEERELRSALGYPPYGRLANIVLRGTSSPAVKDHARSVAAAIESVATDGWTMLGPSPAPLSQLKGVWRWHILVKGPVGADMRSLLGDALASIKPHPEVGMAVDVDPLDLM